MSRQRLRRAAFRLIPWLAVLCLLGAQQAAYAHALSHLLAAPAALAQLDGSDRGGAGQDIADPCPSCAAFGALAAAAAAGIALLVAAGPGSTPPAASLLACVADSSVLYQARAPPARL